MRKVLLISFLVMAGLFVLFSIFLLAVKACYNDKITQKQKKEIIPDSIYTSSSDSSNISNIVFYDSDLSFILKIEKIYVDTIKDAFVRYPEKYADPENAPGLKIKILFSLTNPHSKRCSVPIDGGEYLTSCQQPDVGYVYQGDGNMVGVNKNKRLGYLFSHHIKTLDGKELYSIYDKNQRVLFDPGQTRRFTNSFPTIEAHIKTVQLYEWLYRWNGESSNRNYWRLWFTIDLKSKKVIKKHIILDRFRDYPQPCELIRDDTLSESHTQ